MIDLTDAEDFLDQDDTDLKSSTPKKAPDTESADIEGKEEKGIYEQDDCDEDPARKRDSRWEKFDFSLSISVKIAFIIGSIFACLLYTSPSPRDS